MARILIDTNVLVYFHDSGEPAKQQQAVTVLDALQARQMGCISAQTLSEFVNATTRGHSPKLTVAETGLQLERFIASFTILQVTPGVILEAIRSVLKYPFAFYDAQLWAIAKLNQIPVVFSEDLNAGASYDGVQCVNPFAPDFDLDDWM